jgi:hypothetical protein
MRTKKRACWSNSQEEQVTLAVAATARHPHLLAEKMEETVLGMEGLGATSKDASMRGNGGSSACHCLVFVWIRQGPPQEGPKPNPLEEEEREREKEKAH